jgi:hypothetical protein
MGGHSVAAGVDRGIPLDYNPPKSAPSATAVGIARCFAAGRFALLVRCSHISVRRCGDQLLDEWSQWGLSDIDGQAERPR